MEAYQTVRDIADIEKYLKNAKVVAFDFETSACDEYREDERAALDPHKSDITGISLSVKSGTGIYVPLRHRIGENADPIAVMAYLRERVFQNDTVVKIAHNMVFEAMFLYKGGIVLQEPCYDTLAAAQLTLKSDYEFRDLHDSGLKTLVPALFGVELPTFADVTQGHFFDELDPDDRETCRYACADSDWALRLYDVFNGWFDENLPSHRWIVEHIESPTAVYTGMMRYNGVGVDRELLDRKRAEAETKIGDLRSKILSVTGDIDIGEGCSTADFKTFLYETCALPILKTTEKQQPATDDEAIRMLIDYCKNDRPDLVDSFENVKELRKWSKIKSTYIDGYAKWINPATGRIHPDLLPMGTNTGRFAARNPNLQNMPRKDNDPVGVRLLMIPSGGAAFLDFDFSQIELRVGAYYCRDKIMMDTYRTGGDIHAGTTAVIFGIPVEQALNKTAPAYKERRTIAKNVNFGVFYGLFPRGLQHTLKCKAGIEKSVEECAAIIGNLKAGYPELTEWQQRTIRRARLDGYTESSFGRRRYLPDIRDRDDWARRSFTESKE